ncbi:MAG: multiheme c-type cytochrome, partial [candidate division KSB1 bacterium]
MACGVYLARGWFAALFFPTTSLWSSPSPLPLPQADTSKSTIAFEDFMGAEACAPCHAEQYALWKKSTHGNAGGAPGETNVIAPFNGEALQFKDARVVPSRKQNGEYVFTVQAEGEPEQEIKVAAIVGGGHMLGGGTQSFFMKAEGGTLKFLPFDFIRAENTWFVQLRAANEWAPVSREISLRDLANWPPHRILGAELEHSNCQNCHGSQILVEQDALTRRYLTRYQTLKINCESCHGPGRRHIELMQTENAAQLVDLGMKPLATLSKNEALQVCLQCHATKDVMQPGYLPGKNFAEHYAVKFPILGSAPYLPDGRVRFFAYQENHLYSACYLEGSMTCGDCHDPHSQQYRDARGNPLAGR